MERETSKIEINKHVVIIKDYLTVREGRDLFKLVSAEKQKSDNDDYLLKYQDELCKMWIIELDGKKEDFIEDLLNWRQNDFKKLMDIIQDKDKDEEKKTK